MHSQKFLIKRTLAKTLLMYSITNESKPEY